MLLLLLLLLNAGFRIHVFIDDFSVPSPAVIVSFDPASPAAFFETLGATIGLDAITFQGSGIEGGQCRPAPSRPD